MANQPKTPKKPKVIPAALPGGPMHNNQFLDQRRRDNATRSTLSRLRNRKSTW